MFSLLLLFALGTKTIKGLYFMKKLFLTIFFSSVMLLNQAFTDYIKDSICSLEKIGGSVYDKFKFDLKLLSISVAKCFIIAEEIRHSTNKQEKTTLKSQLSTELFMLIDSLERIKTKIHDKKIRNRIEKMERKLAPLMKEIRPDPYSYSSSKVS
jgi:hypothetical protein